MFDDEEEDTRSTATRDKETGEMWDLARYVEEHPEDHAERWRLAKKMYLSWEYRHALDHLVVLKNEWSPRLNVMRYLAATYYRLGRHEEAMQELEQGLARWPEDLGLREQLARVKEIAGDRVGASKVWENIAEISPAHPTAQSAIRRLHAEPKNTPKEDLGIGESDSGVDLRMGVVCPQCGAQSSNEEMRCWQCNELLNHASPPPTRKQARALSPIASGPSIETLVSLIGFVGLAFAVTCVYLSVRLMMDSPLEGASLGYQDLYDLYQHGMARTRLTLGAVLYVGYPFALWTAINYFKVALRVPPAFVTLTAFTTAGIAFLCTWLPINAMWLFAVLPPFTAALLIIGAFQMPPRQALAVWGLHLGIIFFLIPIGLLSAERIQLGRFYNPFTEFPKVVGFVQRQGAEAEPGGTLAIEDADIPISQRVRWESTGSPWLDARAGEMFFTITSKQFGELIFEIKDSTGTRFYEDVGSEVWSTSFPVKSNEVYELYVRGPKGARASLEIGGIMKCTLVP